MELKDQVCTFEQAKRLKELGVKQESLFYYFQQTENDDPDVISCDIKDFFNHAIFHSAFTVAELGDMLPKILPCESYDYGMVLVQNFPDGKEQSNYTTEYISIDSDMDYVGSIFEEEGSTEAESRASMLIFLLESEVINVEDLNK